MFGRRIGIGCGVCLVAWSTTAAAQTPTSPLIPPPHAAPLTPYDGTTVSATFNNPQPVGGAQPAAAPTAREPLLLAPPDAPAAVKRALPKAAATGESSSARSAGGGSPVVTTVVALAVALGLFLTLAAVVRRGMPQQARTLPPEAVEMLGRIALPGRRQGHLVRVGNKIALISFSNAEARPLLEVTDPQEVDRLAGLCKQADPTSATGSFRAIVDQFFREKTPGRADSRAADLRTGGSEAAHE